MALATNSYTSIPLLSDKTIKPYVGAGINYTFFYSSKPGDVTHVDYKNNAGFALQGHRLHDQ